MEFETYSYDLARLITFANEVKELLLRQLAKDEMLKKPFDELSGEYEIVLIKKSWLKRLLSKNDEKEYLFFRFLKKDS